MKFESNASRLLVVAIVAVMGFGASFSVPAHAQSVGATLTGVVTDEVGADIPGASVSIKNEATGTVRESQTNASGLYSVPNLLPGSYDVTVTQKGFAKAVSKNIVLTVGKESVLNVSLKVGQTSETVEVRDVAPTIETGTSSIDSTVDSTTIRELPLNGRDWTSLATLQPGVGKVNTQVTTAFSANKGNRGFGNQLTDSGHRPNENSYRVNGIIVNDYSNAAPGGATGLNLGVDAVQEFSVVTTGYTSEYGKTSGAIINAITKSGTNSFHGDGFFFDRDKVFDAKNFFDPPGEIPPFRRIQFGGSAGGPIVKDKTFISGAYEGVRQNQPASQVVSVPTAEARNGQLCVALGGDPCNSLQTIAVDPRITPYLALWPCPAGCQSAVNSDAYTYNVALPSIANENYYTWRLDQKFGKQDTFASSYFFDSGPQRQPDPLQNATHQVFSRRQMASLEETHTFGAQWVNTARFGFSRVIGKINDPVSGDSAATSAALAIAPGAKATPQIAIPGVITTAIGLGGLNRFSHAWNSYQGTDDVFATFGKHQIAFGGMFERMQYNVLEQLSPNGRMNGYKTLEIFLTNQPHQLNALAPGQSHEVAIRESLAAFYVQDDWRARKNLTLNIGLRYEATTRPTDANNNIEEITTLVNCSASPTACGPVHVGSFIASNPTLKNFQPRLGFSYDPFGSGTTAIRGAFGMFDVLPLPYEFGLNTAATSPYQIIGKDKNALLGTGTADPNVSFDPTQVRNRYVQQNPKRALVMNWNMNIERQFGAWSAFAGYVGSRSTHLSVAADDINLVQPISTPYGLLWPVGGTAIDPNWAGGTGGSGIRPVLFDGAGSYEAAQFQLRKTMSYGLEGQISYTFGKCRDTSSAPVTGDTYATSIAVPILFSKSYRVGACDFDIRHNLSGNFVWQIPTPKADGFKGTVMNGWQLGTIITALSGSPFTPTIGGGGDPLGTGFNGDFSMDFADLVPNCNPIHGGVNYLNTNCFALPSVPLSALTTAPFVAAGGCVIADPLTPLLGGFTGAPKPPPSGTMYCSNLLGNAGRNSLYGPKLTTLDMSLFKNFKVTRISESFNLQFRAEFFNVLNHPNLQAPNFLTDNNNNSIFDANGTVLGNAGALGSTTTSSRQIQLGLKINW